jgi:serine/threonine-protein kinase
MADVYLAVARGPMGFNKLTVIKRLRADLASDPSFLNMLLDEARLAARLSHPNVVHTYEVGEERGTYFIAMEYLEGQPLNRVVNASAREKLDLPHALSARIVADALAGLHYAHELRDYDGTPLRIVHRDISPHNIFVTYDGVVKLMDFGIAKAASSSASTEVGVLKGKVAYMSPEQAMAAELDRRADVFSMGIVLWELLAGQRLFPPGPAAATLHKLLSQPLPRLADAAPTVDPKLVATVNKALEKDPEKRFQTAQELRNALESFIVEGHHIVRQEEIGRTVTQLFEDTREVVQKQIQTHMAEVSLASSTGELAALNRDALRRGIAAEPTPSGRNLLRLDSPDSQSGSGVLPTASPESLPTGQGAGKKKGGALVFGAAIALLLLGVIAFVAFRPTGPRSPEGTASIGVAAEPRGAPVPPPPQTTTAPPAAATVTPAAPIPTGVASVPEPPPASPAANAAPTAAAHHAHGTSPPTPKPGPAPTPAPSDTSAAAPSAAAADVGTGFVTLDTYPWSRVSENGKVLGVTPLIHQALPAGSHTLTLENPDQGIKQTYVVTVKPGETVSRRLGLQ